MKTKFLVVSFTLASLMLVTSCQSKKSEVKKASATGIESIDSGKIKEEVVKIISALPSNTETVKLINSTGAAYLAGFTGENLKTENLLTRADKAKAYGTVIFDLAYTNTYKQVESFNKLLKVYETLTTELGFEELIQSHKDFKVRYQNNKDNSDSVDMLVGDMLKHTNDMIQKSGSTVDISLIFGGTVIKSLNVITYITLFAPAKDKLIETLQKQKELVNAACIILEKSPGDPDVSKFYQTLTPINNIFNSQSTFTEKTVEEINKLTDFISK